MDGGKQQKLARNRHGRAAIVIVGHSSSPEWLSRVAQQGGAAGWRRQSTAITGSHLPRPSLPNHHHLCIQSRTSQYAPAQNHTTAVLTMRRTTICRSTHAIPTVHLLKAMHAVRLARRLLPLRESLWSGSRGRAAMLWQRQVWRSGCVESERPRSVESEIEVRRVWRSRSVESETEVRRV